jgi:hypothetical protein
MDVIQQMGESMTRAKQILLCLLVCLALGAAGAPAASAASPAWWVEGSPLASGATEAIAETTEVLRPFVVRVSSFSVECRLVKVKSGVIEGENKAGVKALVAEGCSTSVPGCTIAGSTIETKPLSILLEGSRGALKLNFKPVPGPEMETVNFTGSGCALGRQVIDGTMACDYPEVETEKTSHLLEFTSTSGSKLETSTKLAAELSGLDSFWLSLPKKWSAK